MSYKTNIIKETKKAKGIKQFLEYDSDKGGFIWKKQKSGMKKGNKAGCIKPNGYVQIKYNNKGFKTHRLAWYFVYGYFPENEIDHINGIRHDNRIENLREVSHRCNLQNRKRNVNNTSGICGVRFNKKAKKWHAQISLNNKYKYLGLYNSRLEAALARLNAELVFEEWKCDLTSKTYKAIQIIWPEYVNPYLENEKLKPWTRGKLPGLFCASRSLLKTSVKNVITRTIKTFQIFNPTRRDVNTMVMSWSYQDIIPKTSFINIFCNQTALPPQNSVFSLVDQHPTEIAVSIIKTRKLKRFQYNFTKVITPSPMI